MSDELCRGKEPHRALRCGTVLIVAQPTSRGQSAAFLCCAAPFHRFRTFYQR
jgi:hypothetical protein